MLYREPSEYTEDQRDMHFIVTHHGWKYAERFDPSKLEPVRIYVRDGVVCATVEEAYIANKALIALER